MFIFWLSQIGVLTGIIFAMLKLLFQVTPLENEFLMG